jgi:NAD(P)-dependent dehydrogenase (short-subunit alcohol dehydrogenase family)
VSYELGPLGVALSIVEPGPFRTDILLTPEIHRSAPEGPYAALSDVTETALRSLGSNAPDPDPVVAAVVKALSAKKPRLRYPVGAEARLISACKGVLPHRVFGFVVLRATGMTHRRPHG